MSLLITDTIKNLISNDRTQDAINIGLNHAKKHRKDLHRDLILLSAQYVKWIKDKNIGIINSNQTINRINLSLLSIADQFEKKIISSNREKGQIINLEGDKRYGFIKTTSKKHNENIFFHYSNIENRIHPKKGQKVSFELSIYKKNLVAVNIFILKNSTKKSKTNQNISKRKPKNKKNNSRPKSHSNTDKSIVDYNLNDWKNLLKLIFVEFQKILKYLISKVLK